jgi:hypothetical protein
MWLMEHTNQIASRVNSKKVEQIKSSVSKPPKHLNE